MLQTENRGYRCTGVTGHAYGGFLAQLEDHARQRRYPKLAYMSRAIYQESRWSESPMTSCFLRARP